MNAMLLGPHLCPSHMGEDDDIWLEELQPPVVKVFSQGNDFPRLDVALRAVRPDGVVILRHHATSENFGNRGFANTEDAKAKAKAGYERLIQMCPPNDFDRIAVEGLNEPEVWSWGSEPIPLVIEYYAEFGRLFWKQGIRTVFLNIGVGWPGNDEPATPPGSIPNWAPYADLEQIINAHHGFLGLHEYWYTNGPREPWVEPDGKVFGGWGWWAGRLRACPFNCLIMITECGIDAHVLPGKGYYGFHGLNPANGSIGMQYFEQLKASEGQYLADGRVMGMTPFLYDFYNPEWATYDMRTQECQQIWLAHSQAEIVIPDKWPMPATWQGQPTPTPTPTPVPPAVVWGNDAIAPWYDLCKKYGDQYGLSPEIVGTTIMVESGGKESIVSSAGAVGLMQVMPFEAGPDFSDRPTKAELLDPDTNVEWGCKILSGYRASHGGSLARGLAGYYGGNKAADNLGSTASVTYLTLWVKWWLRLWKTELPFGTTAPASDDTAVRWNAEEAVRAIEAARTRLLDNVIAPLYGKG